ncbi:hypothetical protein [Nonomuraea soli]|uniref:LPXTG-motif cell wall-anchored protein n=1 Tax=Nonomuraea soli TaxID=1032476 RepID=A0A7W0CUE0_9ACTN|nr:hypothetical protein [Nonomuraea soli]MBA2897363.1 LPXTG-motif cell wall-anchored protein [Nonomuraea soli]
MDSGNGLPSTGFAGLLVGLIALAVTGVVVAVAWIRRRRSSES